MGYSAGFATLEITPQKLPRLSGYDGIRQAMGVHDKLYVHTVVFKKDDEYTALLSLDLLGISDLLRECVYQKVRSVIKSIEQLQMVATHTHSGPVGIHDTSQGVLKGKAFAFGELDEAYLEFVAMQCAQSIQDAISNCEPQKLRISLSEVEGVGTNRNHPSQPVDQSCLTMAFESNQGSKNLIFRYACHPTVLNATNTQISADLLSAVYQGLNHEYDNIIYLNGSAGDISTRFTRQESSFSALSLLGKRVCEAIMNEDTILYDGDFNSIRVKNLELSLAMKEPKSIHELEALLAITEDANLRLGLKSELLYANTNPAKTLDVSCGLLSIQNINFALCPFEVYDALTDNKPYFVSFANDYLSYLPDKAAYDAFEYEAGMAVVKQGMGEYLVEEIRREFKKGKNSR